MPVKGSKRRYGDKLGLARLGVAARKGYQWSATALASLLLGGWILGWVQQPGESGTRGQVYCVAFSPDGQRLASASVDGTVKIWDTMTGQEVFTLPGKPDGHTRCVRSLAFSPDGKSLVTGSEDQTVKLWRAAAEDEVLSRSDK